MYKGIVKIYDSYPSRKRWVGNVFINNIKLFCNKKYIFEKLVCL